MNGLTDFLQNITDTSSWPARWHCGHWTSFHGWLYILSDVAIWAAYFAIPFAMFYIIKKRKDLPFLPIFWLFIVFIFLCGTTHLIDAAMFWYPVYKINALARFFTAIISWVTVFIILRNVEVIMELKGPAELKRQVDERTKDFLSTKQRFKVLANYNPLPITLVNKDLIYVFLNQTAEKNIAKEGLQTFEGLSILISGYEIDFLQKHVSYIKKVFETKQEITYETKYIQKNGNSVDLLIQLLPIMENEEVHEVMTITKNII